ncbi:MAG TPA: sensor domain-containing diguanylate cyclase [Chitinivibrionales bacterium]|nr:sensor domain-containing diguanylate cyclase [Chitinivibrionales bacterium]
MRFTIQFVGWPDNVNLIKPFFPNYNNYSGMPQKAIVAAGALCFTVILVFAVLLGLFKSPQWIWAAFVSLLAASLLGGLLYGFFKYIREFVKRMEKTQLTMRRTLAKSNYLQSILDDSTDIIFTTDVDAFILKFNKGSEMHFGYVQEEIVGVPLKQLFVNEADERKILNAVILSGKSVNEEIPMKTKQGEIILLNLSISEMKNDAEQIIGLVVTAKDITEKKKLENELVKKNELLSKLAITDSLTELFNVRHFYDQIARELSRLKRNPQRKLSLMLIDIDHFKELNDSEGHQVGDQVLRSLGQVIKVCIRKDVDAGFRYGGDEFAVILPDTDKNQAKVAAERIAKQFGAFKFGRVSLSIGIAEAMAGEDEKSIVKRTDEALYRSKREGRARITLEE